MWAWWLYAILLCGLTEGVRNHDEGVKAAGLQNRLHNMELKMEELQSTNSELVSNTATLIKEIKRSGMIQNQHKHHLKSPKHDQGVRDRSGN